MRAVVWLGLAIAFCNVVYERFIPILNTPDPVDAVYGLAGTGLGLLVLAVIDRRGLIPNPALAPSG